MVLISKAFLSAKTETITALGGGLSNDFRAKERGRPDYWIPLNKLNSHKLNKNTNYTYSQANYVFGHPFSTSNTVKFGKLGAKTYIQYGMSYSAKLLSPGPFSFLLITLTFFVLQ